METRHHADRVIERTHASNDLTPLTASWRRSALRHGLDPAQPIRARRLTAAELAARREAMGPFLSVAAQAVDELYRVVSGSGCAVLLTDADGILLDRRASAADAPAFDAWALAPGADWSEAAQGDAMYDLASLTLGHAEHLADVVAGYGADVDLDLDLIRGWWSFRSLRVIRWLGEHGFDPWPELAVLNAQ